MEVQNGNTRVRINLAQTAKGLVQFDVTAEAETAILAKSLLNEAIDSAKKTIAEKGLKEVGSE